MLVAGMTGGVAYLYDPTVDDDMVAGRLKLSNVKPRRVQNGSPAADTIKRLLREHHEATASKHAKHLLEWTPTSPSARSCRPRRRTSRTTRWSSDAVGEMAVSR